MSIEKMLDGFIGDFSNVSLSRNATNLIINYKECTYTHECNGMEEIKKIEVLLNMLSKLAMNYSEINITINNENSITLHEEIWEEDFEIDLDVFDFDKVNLMLNITQYISSRDSKIKISLNSYFNGGVLLKKEKWAREVEFGNDDVFSTEELYNTFTDIRNFFDFTYKERSCCYSYDYIEFPIMMGNSHEGYFGMFEELHSIPESIYDKEITFEISKISIQFWNYIFKELKYEFEESHLDTHISTLKIYNLNSFLNIERNDPSFIMKCNDVVKNILFKLSYKYSVHLEVVEIPDYDDESYIDDHYEEMEKFQNISEYSLSQLYDNDLISYYYRAMNMELSEFKYLAFYQILECIFDEVHMHATIQDVKQIINADWFSKHDDEDIKTMIDVVDTYNKQRSDREKLTLVLEKYFKGNLHDKAFFIANRSLTELLLNMELINDYRDLKNLKKIVDIIYDFRCKCTHSNRAFPSRGEFNNSKSELEDYINLVRMFSEKIILNYGKQ